MGIIIKQSAKGTFWTYAGVLIGFITTTYLYPNFLTPEVIGLFGLLVSISFVLGKVFLLGLPGVTNRLFPYFRSENKDGHQGFLFLASLFQLTGVILFLITYFIFSPKLIEMNSEKSPLFADYMYLLLPLTISYMVFFFLDTYNKMIYDAVFGTFLQEFIQRLIIILIVVLYALQIINIHQLIILYASAVSIKALFIIFLLLKKGEVNIHPNLKFLTKNFRKEIMSVAAYSVIGGVGSIFIFNIDKIIIHNKLDLAYTGIYTIAVYFGSIVSKPSQPLLKISGTLVADAWKQNDLNKIRDIYYRSCLNQLIIGGFIFLGIWANIENVLIILGDQYLEARWVIFFIGLGYLIDMSTGSNGQIISLSKYYRVNLIFTVLLIGLVLITMLTFIPKWGIVGGAIGIMISLFAINLLRFIFLYRKYRLNPFNYRFLLIIGVYALFYFLISLMPQLDVIPDILLRSGLITIATFLVLWKLPVSEDISNIINTVIQKSGEILTRILNFGIKK